MAVAGKRKRNDLDVCSFPVHSKVRVRDPGEVMNSDPDIEKGTIGFVIESEFVPNENYDGYVWVHATSTDTKFRISPQGLEVVEPGSFPTQVMKHMWDSRKETGDVVVCSGADEILAHRCVLESVSPVFAAALNGAMKEGLRKRLDLTDSDISKNTFEDVLQLIYTDSHPANLDIVSALELARKYMMVEVSRRLGKQAIPLANAQNVAHIARLLKDLDAMEGSDTHFVDALLDAHGQSKDLMKAIVLAL